MGKEIEISRGFDIEKIVPLSRYAERIAKTEFVPSNLRNRPEAVLACIMTGQEIGIDPMQALRQIDIIDGRPALRAELMRAKVFQAGHEIWFGEGNEFTTTRVVAYGQRAGGGVVRVEWSMDMARSAGLANKNNWKNHPRAMLAARATSEVCRLVFPDVIAGMGYTSEELMDGASDDQVVDAEVVEDRKTTKRKVANKKPAPKAPPRSTSQADIPEPGLPDEDDDVIDVEVIEDAPKVNATDQQGNLDTTEQTSDQKARSRQVVRLAKALGIDHHPVVSAITNGVTDSASRLDADDAWKIMDTLRGMSEGRLDCVFGSDGRWQVHAVEELPNVPEDDDDDVINAEIVEYDEGEDDPEDWDSDKWRELLKEHDLKVSSVIKHLASITPEGQTPVGSLQGISGSGVAARLLEWVEKQ